MDLEDDQLGLQSVDVVLHPPRCTTPRPGNGNTTEASTPPRPCLPGLLADVRPATSACRDSPALPPVCLSIILFACLFSFFLLYNHLPLPGATVC
ncbi:hypothetical protein SORBI_3009G139600 [Sorghum bicolor]|uniref:Uncharacterized protein n=1 Tax=Sorghum bicolor TaxID=4558 RepID=A0A1B6P8P5_SORBI|nr:hypothetical protein SORBI_3009G139600 [Sorghum bicolor]